jgi:hypothetical protein
MNCATHNDTAVAFCRTCGKPLCGNCTRDVRGVIYCEPCLAARLEGTAPAAAFVPPQTTYPPVGGPARPLPSSGPNPAVAGILGAIPFGIGAVYNGQYAKGLAHMFIFGLLIYGADHAGSLDWLFGVAIPFFIVYQIIDAVRTAKALQAGQPAPDPMGIGQAFGTSERIDASRIPVGAVVLIALGVLFLLHTMGIMEHGFERFWPLLIVVLGGWLFYRNYERGRRTCECARCTTRWLMGPAMVLTTGILFLLDSMDIAEVHRTWPAWILVVGVVKLLQSSASSTGHVGPLPPGPPPAAPPPPSPSSSSNQESTSPSGEIRNV